MIAASAQATTALNPSCRRPLALIVSFALLSLALLTCLSTVNAAEPTNEAREPQWVRLRPQPEDALIGIGQASGEHAREQSRALAVVEISEQLVVSVRSSMESDSSSETTANDDTSTVSLRESLRRRIQSDTASNYLPGVEIVAQETVGDTVYTMARLQRQRFREAVHSRAQEIDRELEPIARLDQQRQEGEADDGAALISGEVLSRLSRAYQLSDERAQLASLLSTQGDQLQPPPMDLATITSRLGRLAQGNQVRLQGASEAPSARDAILDVIDLLGLTVIQSENAPFELRLRERQRSRKVGEWTRATVTVALTAVDRHSGEVIGSLEHSVEKSSVQGEEEAVARAREAIISEFGAVLQQRLLNLLAGQGQR